MATPLRGAPPAVGAPSLQEVAAGGKFTSPTPVQAGQVTSTITGKNTKLRESDLQSSSPKVSHSTTGAPEAAKEAPFKISEGLKAFGRSLLRAGAAVLSPVLIPLALGVVVGYTGVAAVHAMFVENTFSEDMGALDSVVGSAVENSASDIELTKKLFSALFSCVGSAETTETHDAAGKVETPKAPPTEAPKAAAPAAPAASSAAARAAKSTAASPTVRDIPVETAMKLENVKHEFYDPEKKMFQVSAHQILQTPEETKKTEGEGPEGTQSEKGKSPEGTGAPGGTEAKDRYYSLEPLDSVKGHYLQNKNAIFERMQNATPPIAVDRKQNVLSEGAKAPSFNRNNNYGLTPDKNSVKTDPEGSDNVVSFTTNDGKVIFGKGDRPADLPKEVPYHKLYLGYLGKEDGKVYANPQTRINCDNAKIQESKTGPQTHALTDGCGWGEGSQDAATIAANTAQEYVEVNMNKEGSKVETLRDVVRLHQEAFDEAQKLIMAKQLGNKCTTTMTLVTRIKGADGKVYRVVTTLGDPKVYCIKKDGKAQDLTTEKRVGKRDGTDCGGRLGDYATFTGENGEDVEGGDYRNMRVSITEEEEGDMLIMASDGLHDNVDPEGLNMTPQEVHNYLQKQDPTAFTNPDDWKALQTTTWDDKNPIHRRAVTEFQSAKVADIARSRPDDPLGALDQDCARVSEPSKIFMLCHNTRLPTDYKKYPGKMDHEGIMVVRS